MAAFVGVNTNYTLLAYRPVLPVFFSIRPLTSRVYFKNFLDFITLPSVPSRPGRIFTSGQKSVVTIVFLDPDYLHDARISAIHVHLRQI